MRLRAYPTTMMPILAATLALTGCGDDTPATTGGGTTAFGEADIVAAYGSFTTTGFTQISTTGVASQHQLADLVIVWAANGAVATDYAAIDPDDADATAGPFPEGSIIIKQHLDAAGVADGSALVMGKMAAGFNPDANDWWWGRFTETGSLADKGVVGYCIDCHRANGFDTTDYLGGVETGNK